MNSIGEDVPVQETIEQYGIVSACAETTGNFALYKDGDFAARGRLGTSPLYWNKETREFSFRPRKNFEEFPTGCVYIYEYDRIVVWDEVFFEKPLRTNVDAVAIIRQKIEDAVDRFIDNTDGFLFSAGCGSRLVNEFVPNDMMAYTVSHLPGYSIDGDTMERNNRVKVTFDDTSHWPSDLRDCEIPMYILAEFLNNSTDNKRFITGIGCYELFSGTNDFRPHVSHIVDQFSKFGLEVWSPFFDITLIEYIMDMTKPSDREMILKKLLKNDVRSWDGYEIYNTVGDKFTGHIKKTWWYW
jgi:hypothetical protein